MDIARLKALRELSLRGTMTAAAQALHLTPSAVSQQIAQLEDEAGMPLTERSGRGVRLTPAGDALVAHTDRLLVVLDEAKSELALLRNEVAGPVRVAAFATAAAALLPTVLQCLRRRYPLLQVKLVEMEPAEGLAALASWSVDLAIVDDLTARLARMDKTLDQVPLIDDELRVVMHKGHRLAQKRSITLGELADEDWALDSAGSFYGEFVLDLCRRSGFTPRVNAECRGVEIIAAMVAAGCSVAVVPGLRLGQMPRQLRARPLRPTVKRRISAAFRIGDRSHPAMMAIVQQLQAVAQSKAR